MQSAGLRTRIRGRSVMATGDDSTSIMTLHSLDDDPASPISPRRSLRAVNRVSATPSSPPLIIQRPDSIPVAPSQLTSSNASLIIQRHEEPSRPSTAPSVPKPRRKKIEQLVPDYRPATSATDGTHLTAATAATAATAVTDFSDFDFDVGQEPPRFTIDLSKPPQERYHHVAPHFRANKKIPQRLFDDLVRDALGKKAEFGRKWARRLLRKLPSQEEQEELIGISRAWGVELYLLIAFNVLLDSFMGCTSGGVRVKDTAADDAGRKERKGRSRKLETILHDPPDSRGRMLHFRTLDWSMDPLRRVVCQYDYVQRPGGDVVARVITYFGFVGVLTGVRKGLSISLNFRPVHDASSIWKRAAFRLHQVMVFLGFRRGIASSLRDALLPSKYDPIRMLPTLVDVERDLPPTKSTAAYLIFSDGARTTTFEKDYKSAIMRSASDFIVATNHDAADDRSNKVDSNNMYNGALELIGGVGDNSAFSSAAPSRTASPSPGRRVVMPTPTAIAAAARLDRVPSGPDSFISSPNPNDDALSSMRADPNRSTPAPETLDMLGLGSLLEDSRHRKRCISRHWRSTKKQRGGPAVHTNDVLQWMRDPALCSDETHYACVMDPTKGEIVWMKRWVTPLRPDAPR